MTQTIRRARARLLGADLLGGGLVAVAALALLAGCAGTPSGAALVGTWGSTAASQPNLTIENDGAFSGTDGCNRLTGKGSIDGDTITFGPIASTMMACTGVDEWLGKASSGTAKGSTLVVYDINGSQIGTLDKK
ncbi:META domain-containing protein [Leifsonia shinshuensis]|uniref:META domain-containing protein n=1 Tax=Leifsonia shinshuensis TaxID=150026 RepID=A0A7G6YCY6_9MICO|nr:META domain-containing protein [Leifsonia shinshuensis]QNE36351.1 META domain-containing protein [Leifsonia shinshuensis]